nr:HNH endonuclease family protein [Streptomyces aquilus]
MLVPAFTHTAVAAPPRAKAPGDTVTLPVRDALEALPVRAEDTSDYSREAFRHWIDADRDGCNTRAEVLKAEAVVAPQQGARCTLSGGEWYSEYDNLYVEGPRGLDIDHRVPLGEAWESGAFAWSAAEREAYANDLGDDRALIAVTGSSNRAKGKKDPAEWQPPYAGNSCAYNTAWVAVKTRWGQTVDAVEKAALTEQLSHCPNVPVTVTLAR